MIQAIAIIASGCLFAWGGYSWNVARRYFIPILLTGVCLYLSKSLWALTMFTCIPVFCMGYGEDAPLVHVFGGGWGRSVWGLLGATALSLGLFLTGHVPLIGFICYLAVCFTLENALKNLWQVAGDLIIGIGFGSICLLVH